MDGARQSEGRCDELIMGNVRGDDKKCENNGAPQREVAADR
jgi:hypothetical protein